jgi:hypothetical protein
MMSISSFSKGWLHFDKHLKPQLLKVVQDGSSFYDMLERLGEVRAVAGIPMRVQQVVDEDGRMVQFGYDFPARQVKSKGDEKSDRLLEALIIGIQAINHVSKG